MLEFERLSKELSEPIDMTLFADVAAPNVFYLPPPARFHCPKLLELFHAKPAKKPQNVRVHQGRLDAWRRYFGS